MHFHLIEPKKKEQRKEKTEMNSIQRKNTIFSHLFERKKRWTTKSLIQCTVHFDLLKYKGQVSLDLPVYLFGRISDVWISLKYLFFGFLLCTFRRHFD